MSEAASKSVWTPETLKELFKSFPILEGFSQHLIDELAQASQVLEVPPNTTILQQGQANEHLYFLVQGQVGVFVDGGRVTRLQRKGDLLGEMSVISNKTVGATIMSETDVTIVRVNSRVFLEMTGPERDLYLSILYRIYSTVLADKLHQTNQKAKYFEELNIKLTAAQAELEQVNQGLEKKVEERTQSLEQQNAALTASVRKMEELLHSKRVLFKKLSAFESNNLAPLKVALDEARQKLPGEKAIDDARSLVFEVQQILGPMTEQYSSEQAVQGKKVLVADPQRKQVAVAKMALGGTGVELDTVTSLEEGREKIQANDYDLVMFDSALFELGNLAFAKNPQTSLVLITSEALDKYLPILKALKKMPQLVSRDDSDRIFTVKNILTTANKLLSRDFFGLEKYLSWGVDVQHRVILGSRQRPELLQYVDQYFEKVGVRRSNRDRITMVLEELLMNAIYDAPVDAQGKALFNHLARSEDVVLKSEQQGLLRFATDGMIVAVSVQDPFGSLKTKTIFHYLEQNYYGNAQNVHGDEKKGGGGRGLHQIIENADLVVFNVEPGKKTEVVALFNVEVKERGHQGSSFHLFFKD